MFVQKTVLLSLLVFAIINRKVGGVLMRKMNEGIQKVAFLARNPENSPNGLYLIMGGTTYPSPDYCIIRTERSGIFWGGVYVLEYIKSGRGIIEADGAVYSVEAGDLVFMNARRRITYYSDPKDPYSKVWVNFTGPLAEGIVSGLSLKKSIYFMKYDAEMLIREIHGLWVKLSCENRAEAFDRMASLILRMLLSVNRLDRASEFDESHLSTAERVKRYLDGFLIPNITLDDAAEFVGMNKNYIIHAFRKRYGTAPNQYIINRRVECAKKMLVEKKMSIGEISAALHYSSTQHFSKSFKQVSGMTPGRYRKMFKDGT